MEELQQTLTNSAFQPDNVEANVQAIDNFNILSNIGVVRWNVDRNNIAYQKQDSHTLSIYLRGGESTYRADKESLKGSPGKICLMPEGHESQWHINGEIEFVHLYFTDQMLKQYAASNFDTDIRFIELRDLIYQEDETLRMLFQQYLSLCDNSLFSSPLFAEQVIHKVMHHLLQNYNGFQIQDHKIKGGLSPHHMRLLKTFIQEQIAEKHSIESLANKVNLSPFHFARMFKESFGVSPAAYITRIRIDEVKRILKTNLKLSEVSFITGFSQQSHMTKNFKAFTGMTPGIYRQRL